jgi:parallel beta-helix repeat protein
MVTIDRINSDYTIYYDEQAELYRAMCNKCGGTDYSNSDAATVIQNAIDALTNGGKIFIKRGTYLISTSITMKSSIVLEGEGYNKTILKLANNVNDTLIKIGDGTNTIARVEIKELTLDGNKDNNSAGHGIHVNTVELCRLLVKNVYIQYFKEHGIYLEHGGGAIIDSIRFIDCDGNGSKVTSPDHLFSNIVVAKSGLSCISLEHEHSHLTSFHVWGGGQLGTTATDQCGVYISGRKYTVISGESESNKRIGVAISDSTIGKNHIIGVLCWNNGSASNSGRGISFLASKHNTVVGCSCYDLRDPAYQDYGIQEYGASDYNIIISNNVQDNTDAGIIVVGSHTVVKNNDGFVTENSGVATISNGTSSKTVNHDLASTPTKIALTGKHSEVANLYVDTIDSTQFTIHARDGNVTADREVFWQAEV